jgi:hypothetical protein
MGEKRPAPICWIHRQRTRTILYGPPWSLGRAGRGVDVDVGPQRSERVDGVAAFCGGVTTFHAWVELYSILGGDRRGRHLSSVVTPVPWSAHTLGWSTTATMHMPLHPSSGVRKRKKVVEPHPLRKMSSGTTIVACPGVQCSAD